MEMANASTKLNISNDLNLLQIPYTYFKNEDYILKLNSMHMLKFFKDELSIKYIGKGYNSIDYAVRLLYNPLIIKIKYLEHSIK